MNILIWNEFRHEREDAAVRAVYPDGIHAALAGIFAGAEHSVTTATLDEPEHGLTGARLDAADVLLWWGHKAHDAVDDRIVHAVHRRVLAGLGLIVLHSGHHAKIFRALTGTTCNLAWREAEGGERERVWTVLPSHPIAQGVPAHFEVPASEMYGEPFDVPQPDALVFLSWYQGGEVFRSGCCFERGGGRIFYFSPGHETFPIYHDPHVRRVIANAADWVAARDRQASGIPVVNRAQPLEAGVNPQPGHIAQASVGKDWS